MTPSVATEVDATIRFCSSPSSATASSSKCVDGDVPGYQINPDALRWIAGDGRGAADGPDATSRGRRNPAAGQRLLRRVLPPLRRSESVLEAREHTAQVDGGGPRGAGRTFPDGGPPAAVLLTDDGARRRHRAAERRQPAQRSADAGQLRATQRPGGSRRAACTGLHLLRGTEPSRPVLLPPARARWWQARSLPPRIDLAQSAIWFDRTFMRSGWRPRSRTLARRSPPSSISRAKAADRSCRSKTPSSGNWRTQSIGPRRLQGQRADREHSWTI